MTSTLLWLISPDLSPPVLLAQSAAAQQVAGFAFNLEQQNRPVTAGHHLTARAVLRADNGSDDLSRFRRGGIKRQQGGLPNRPALSIQPAKRTRIRPGNGSNKVIDFDAG